MLRMGKHSVLVILVAATLLATTACATTRHLSLNPYGARLDNGASLIGSGYDGPIRLPANNLASSFALGFTIPHDYVANTDLIVEIIWETPATGCNFHLRPSFLFRARAGHPRDFGGASSGLNAVDATTPFTIGPANVQQITIAAPATAYEGAKVRFKIIPVPGEFPTLQPGDAVDFAIARFDNDPRDTCTQALGIAGISIVYEARP